MERLAKGKHSSLLQKSVNYDRKKFYSTDPLGLNYKTLQFCNVLQRTNFVVGYYIISSVTKALALTDTLAYYGIRTLQMRNVL